jgi:hypothetical protein
MLVPFLIGVVVGAVWALTAIFSICVVVTKVKWHEHSHVSTAVCYRVSAVEAENAQLRVSLAAGQMTEEGKKIATMTMAALDAVIAAAKKEVAHDG